MGQICTSTESRGNALGNLCHLHEVLEEENCTPVEDKSESMDRNKKCQSFSSCEMREIVRENMRDYEKSEILNAQMSLAVSFPSLTLTLWATHHT